MAFFQVRTEVRWTDCMVAFVASRATGHDVMDVFGGVAVALAPVFTACGVGLNKRFEQLQGEPVLDSLRHDTTSKELQRVDVALVFFGFGADALHVRDGLYRILTTGGLL